MTQQDSVAVCSRSFSRDEFLRSRLNEKYLNVSYNDTGRLLVGEELIEFLSGKNKAIIGLETVDDELLSRLPELKLISKYGVGTDTINLNALHRFGVSFGWSGGLNKRAVSELVIGQVISLLRKTLKSREMLFNGKWEQTRGQQISGKTIGVIGCGNIGQDLITLLSPFGCNFLAHDIKDYHQFYDDFGVEKVALDDLLARSDVVSLHLPLNESTVQILNYERLNLLKKGAIVVNAARGGLVDENHLLSLVRQNWLGGAVLDVFELEPPENLKVLKIDNLLATSHIGGSSEEAIRAMGLAAIDGLEVNSLVSSI